MRPLVHWSIGITVLYNSDNWFFTTLQRQLTRDLKGWEEFNELFVPLLPWYKRIITVVQIIEIGNGIENIIIRVKIYRLYYRV